MIDKKVLQALEQSAKQSTDGSKLIRYIIFDILSFGKKKSWADYSLEEYGVAYKNENCRQRYKKFRFENLPKDEWVPGAAIEEEFKELIDEALLADGSKVITTEDMLLPEVPEGFQVSRIYSQQSREGLKWLHSLERTRGVDPEEETNKLLSTFENIVLQHEPTKIFLMPQSKPTNWAMNVYISDAHIGAAMNDSLFGVKNDKEDFNKLIKYIVSEIEKKHSTYGTFDTINVIMLGDMLDGWNSQTTRQNHKLVQNMNNEEQFETFVKGTSNLFHTLISEGFSEKLRFVSATNDNHAGSFGHIASRAVEIYLNAKFPDVETVVSSDFIFHIQTGRRVHILTHGKNKDSMKFSIPFVLNQQNQGWFENYIRYNKLDRGMNFGEEKYLITAVLGDLHQSKTEILNNFTYKRVMAAVKGTDYSEYNYSKGSGHCGFEIDLFDINSTETVETRHFIIQ
jgi:hypothetical protein